MAQLAILGHATRGKEVIEILEMLGGKNDNHCCGSFISRIYFLNDYGYIEGYDAVLFPNHLQLTFEEFLEKYPYKVGDKVIYNGNIEIVNRMRWDGDTVKYGFFTTRNIGELTVENLQPYKKQETIEEFTINAEDIKSSKIVITAQEAKINCDQFVTPNKVEIILGDNFEVVEEDGKWFIVKKQNQYPKTYKECCDILGISTMDNDAQGYKGNLIIRFQELLIARDAYWKIAGKEMGLGKPWENNGKNVYVIGCGIDGEIIKDFLEHPVFRYVLAFPTKEMRDAIYENFKDLINKCKELL